MVDFNTPRPRKPWVMPFAHADVQTQCSRLERLNGLRGMAWGYDVCHRLRKTAHAISIEYSAAGASLGRSDGPKQSSKLMHHYIAGKGAPVRGPRGKYEFDLVGAISADPRGALAERWLDHRLWKMLHPNTTLPGLRELLYDMPPPARAALFDLDPAREGEHVAWRRYSYDEFILPYDMGGVILKAGCLEWHPEEPGAEDAFGTFETLIGLWCEARLMYDARRMRALRELIDSAQNLAYADETFPYIIAPFLAFLSFNGPDRPPRKKPERA